MVASISDILTTTQQGVVAANGLVTQLNGSLVNIAAQLTALSTAVANPKVNSLNTKTGALTFSVVIQTFSANGTYVPTAGMVYSLIESQGGGAGGGGCTITTAGTINGAGGGGAGGYSVKIATAAAVGGSQVVTIGTGGAGGVAGNNAGTAGGDTSVGALCIGKGGSAGGGAGAALSGIPGAGGVAGTGDVAIAGGSGLQGFRATILTVIPTIQSGGNAFYGQGGAQSPGQTFAGSGFGSGGAGASDFNAGAAAAGRAGLGGLIVVTEFVIA